MPEILPSISKEDLKGTTNIFLADFKQTLGRERKKGDFVRIPCYYNTEKFL